MKKKILITGASGLVGSHLTASLLNQSEYEIITLGRKNINNSGNDKIKHIQINFAEEWSESLLPDDLFAIIHLSQAENFRDFPDKAKETFYINTLSTIKLIDYARKCKVSHFIFASTGAVYGKSDEPFKEEDLSTYNKEKGIYAATKYCSEVILENYFSQMNVFILRFFFVYGEGQRSQMLVPRLIDFVREGKPISLEGKNGLEINPIYVEDAVSAILATLKIKGSHTINIGGNKIYNLREICEIIGGAVGKEPIFTTNEELPKNLIGNIERMQTLLPASMNNFEDTIKKLILL